MSEKRTKIPDKPPSNDFEIIDARELAARLHLPVSWVRNHSSASSAAGAKIPHVRFGRYVRYVWGSDELVEWLRRHQCQ